MDYMMRIKKFVVKKEFTFRNMLFRGRFTVKSVNEKGLPYSAYDEFGRYNQVINLNIDLHTCDWFSTSGEWHTPKKGFSKSKKIANRHLRVLIENEVMVMFQMMGVPHRIDKIKINWLHEDYSAVIKLSTVS